MADPSLRTPEIKVPAKTNLSRNRDRRKAASVSAETQKSQPLPLLKLVVLVGCVSVLAALFLAALPDFQPEILTFAARVGMFLVRYTLPTWLFQLGAFWVLYLLRR